MPEGLSFEMAARQYQSTQRVVIKQISELRQKTDEGSTLEVVFDLVGSDQNQLLTYMTAQNLALFPENSEDDVKRILDHINVPERDWNKVIFMTPNPSLDAKKVAAIKYPMPAPFTVFEAVKRFVDLTGLVAKKTLKNFADYCSSPTEKELMLNLFNSKDELAKQVTDKHLGLIDILTALVPSCKPPLAALLQLSQRIMPRYYTIASSSSKTPDTIRIAISLTSEEVDGKPVFGLASRYLKEAKQTLESGGRIESNIFVKDSMFTMPAAGPILMVGPGTGVVPFIGFLETFSVKGKHDGATHLYFGCRWSESDFIYKE